MNALSTWFLAWLHSAGVGSFVLALLNSLWQGVIWAALLAAGMRLIPAGMCRLRYGVSLGCLGGLIVTTAATWSVLRMDWPDDAGPGGAVVSSGIVPVQAEMDAVTPWPAPDTAESIAPTAPAAPAPGASSRPVPERESTVVAGSQPWLPVLAVAWAVGHLLMLVRGFRHLAAARRLLNAPACADPSTLDVLERLRARLRVSRPVRVLLTDGLSVPAVWGVWRPVVLLPAALVSGLTPRDLEAIFAHELAHVRRYDHLVNLGQMLAESAFFFNPAAWWISRQIRLEREACCDAVAAEAVSGRVEYARILTDTAERSVAGPRGGRPVAGTPLLAMTDPAGGSLTERVKRLLVPGFQPEMRLSWRACAALLVVAAALLVALQRGTDVAVALAAGILSDEQRVERLTAEAREVAPEAVDEPTFEEVTISGTLRFAPDVERPERVRVHAYIRKPNGGLHTSLPAVTGGEFRVSAPAGTVWLFFTADGFMADGFATAILGPFGIEDGPEITGQVVNLIRGVTVPIRVVDGEGRPVEGLRVGASATVVHGNGLGVGRATTDAEGIASLTHINPDIEYSLTIEGPGFQKLEPTDGPLDPASPPTYTIERAVPASGTIVNEDGEPVPGVKLKEFITQRGGVGGQVSHSYHGGAWGDVLAETDARGRFVLDQLLDGFTYHLLLEHPDYAPAFLPAVQAGDGDLSATLSKGFPVQGTVTGPADVVEKLRKLTWSLPVSLPSGTDGAAVQSTLGVPVDVERRGEAVHFTIAHFTGESLHLGAAGQWKQFSVSPERSELAWELQPEAETVAAQTRRVVITFAQDGRPVQPDGKLYVGGVAPRDSSHQPTHQWLPVEDGRLSFDAGIGNQVHANSEGLIGFWFSNHDVDWPKPEETGPPIELTIPVRPAGALSGRVLTADGQPAVEVSVSVSVKLEVSAADSPDGRYHTYIDGQGTKTSADGDFFVTPLPLGASCVVSVSDGFYRQVGREFVLTQARVSETARITMQPRGEIRGRVFDGDGRPLRAVPVGLRFDYSRASMSWEPPHLTDSEGRFEFAGVNAAAGGRYVAEFDSRKDYMPLRVVLAIGGENVIRLQPGGVVEGVTVDEDGRPVPGVEVYAVPVAGAAPANSFPFFDAESPTDEAGRFRFSNLPKVPVRLHTRQLRDENEVTVTPGAPGEVHIRGSIVPWHADRLKQDAARR